MTNSQQHFDVAFNNISAVLNLNPDWLNGTGYWDDAVEGEFAPKLDAGQVVKTIDEFGRRAIFIGTGEGNIIIFERYQGKDGVPYGQINFQVPSIPLLSYLFESCGIINNTKFTQFINIDSVEENIGVKLARFKMSKNS